MTGAADAQAQGTDARRGESEAAAGHADAWRPVAPDERRMHGFSPWDLILIGDLVIVGLLLLGNVLLGPAAQDPVPRDPDVVRLLGWLDVLFGLLLFGALPVAWLAATRVEPWRGTLHWLRLPNTTRRSNAYWLGIASLLAVGLWLLLLLLVWILSLAATDPGGDPAFGELVRAGGWPLVIAISIGAGVGEEILFRGVLQRFIGLWGQAAIFGLVHVNQGWIAVGFIFVIALVLGTMLRRGMPLWGLMFAHAAYDLLLLGQLRIAQG